MIRAPQLGHLRAGGGRHTVNRHAGVSYETGNNKTGGAYNKSLIDILWFGQQAALGGEHDLSGTGSQLFEAGELTYWERPRLYGHMASVFI
jgi:hypothetical protein